LAEVQEDTRGLEGAGSRKELSIAEEGAGALTVAEEVGGAADLGTLPPLYSYSPTSGGFSGYSDWVIQCANEIYPIVGISFEGHKLQLLALLTFLEGERRSEAMGERSSIAEKGKREVKNLKSAVNYEARGASSRRRNRKARGDQVVL
jgi:hypothetical protein